MTPRPPPPIQRVRARLLPDLGPAGVAEIPDHFQRVGRVVILKLPESLRPSFPRIGAAFQAEMGVETVLRRRGPIEGALRRPDVERIAGSVTETEVLEHGVRYRFDAATVMFAAGNEIERARLGRLVRPGETVVDLFAGIGYFTLPAALPGRAARVYACELNPTSLGYLRGNIVRNHVEARVVVLPGDNREAPVPLGIADRVILGYLPDSVPWVGRAMDLLRPEGGWLHVHTLTGTRDGSAPAEAAVRAAVEGAGAVVRSAAGRVVKSYGPGREHTVVDAEIVPMRRTAPTG